MIEQVHFSNSVKFFEHGFCERWNVTPYRDIDKPCLFAGVYNQSDVDAINNHKGFKVVWNTGSVYDVFKNVINENLVIMEGRGIPFYLDGYKKKRVDIEIKKYDMFTPTPLGDKIYCYLGVPAMSRMYGIDFVNQLKERVKHEIVIGYLGHDISYVKENYYNNCFVNIKPTLPNAFTTAVELAYMGRYSISNSDAPFCLAYKNVDEAVDLIREESKKIGTVQSSCIGDYFNCGEEWKDINFWL